MSPSAVNAFEVYPACLRVSRRWHLWHEYLRGWGDEDFSSFFFVLFSFPCFLLLGRFLLLVLLPFSFIVVTFVSMLMGCRLRIVVSTVRALLCAQGVQVQEDDEASTRQVVDNLA